MVEISMTIVAIVIYIYMQVVQSTISIQSAEAFTLLENLSLFKEFESLDSIELQQLTLSSYPQAPRRTQPQ